MTPTVSPPRDTNTAVPLVDLGWQHRQIAQDVEEGFAQVLDEASFVLGPAVEDFEARFAGYCGVNHCVGVASGTDAIELALRAIGIRPGDEVVVPANTFVATVGAVVRAGAVPVLADVDDETLLMDPGAVEQRLTRRTRVVLPVQLYGQMAPMQQIGELAANCGAAVIEDAAQSHGARQHGRVSGSFAVAAATSFYPGKNLGAYGDGGAVLTSSHEVATTLRALRNHGGRAKYEHRIPGTNSRLDSMQAVVLTAKLARLDRWNELRRQAAERYRLMLADLPQVRAPSVVAGNEHVWHLYVIRVPDRDAVLGKMSAADIGVGIHYPVPIHLLEAFRSLGHVRGDFPVAEAAAERLLTLPLYPGITPSQQEQVVAALSRALP
jgi:dTDP-4-amino-4,6-dideoxygalactose transaminase